MQKATLQDKKTALIVNSKLRYSDTMLEHDKKTAQEICKYHFFIALFSNLQ